MRIAIAFLLLPFFADAQIVRAWPFYTAPEEAVTTLLLDAYPGAAVAYSLRKLDKDYTGSAIRVRRSSDNAEQDIGFVNNYLDTAAMKTFVGANNGFVVTWYNQADSSGVFGVRNGSQSTAGSQPIIISSGNLVYKGGILGLDFYAAGVRIDLQNSIYFYNQSHAFMIGVANADSSLITSAVKTIFGAYTNSNYKASLIYSFNSLNVHQTGGRRSSSDAFVRVDDTNNGANLKVITMGHLNYSAGIASIYINGGAGVSNNSFHIGTMDNQSNSSIRDNIGGNSSANWFDGIIYEVINYASDQSSNRTAIRNNINAFYSIY